MIVFIPYFYFCFVVVVFFLQRKSSDIDIVMLIANNAQIL